MQRFAENMERLSLFLFYARYSHSSTSILSIHTSQLAYVFDLNALSTVMFAKVQLLLSVGSQVLLYLSDDSTLISLHESPAYKPCYYWRISGGGF